MSRMEMKFQSSTLLRVLLFLQPLNMFLHICSAQGFDFFYFVQQWPGSYCDTKQSCCYPKTGKPPSDFGIHGLWPNYNDGSYPSNCDPSHSYNQSKISDLISTMQRDWATLACPSSTGSAFWSREWEKHGTCSKSVLDQHGYFKAALILKSKVNLLQILQNAGIKPGGIYSFGSITDAVRMAIGYEPGIKCNVDTSGNSQLYQIYICVDTSASRIIECPGMPNFKCASNLKFPSF